MFDTADPRATLTSATSSPTPSSGEVAAAQYVEFGDVPPQVSVGGSSSWFYRGQNFVLAYSRLEAGAVLVRRNQPHEYVVLLTDATSHVRVEAGEASRDITEPAIIVVPPGDSTLTAVEDTGVVRLFDSRTDDMMELALNAAEYAEPHPNVAGFRPWPAPVDGDRLRVYPTDDIPGEEGRFGRIFRTSAFMVNVLDPQEGPRDPEKLSPHHHDDFEQCSLAVEGSFIHHIRTPWTPRRSQWRDDEHRRVGSPSVAIIPPPTLHTSEAVAPGMNRLIDIFCPPRGDFSAKQGWVLNAEEYPQP